VKASRVAVALAFWAGAAAPVVAPAAACAGAGARAALVVDTGAAVTTYCVALPDDSVSGIELVELAGDQHGLDYSLGFGGEAVCRLEGVGPEGDDCFGDYPEFWGYWHGDGSGEWSWAGTGAGSATIEDGDVDGWSWGTGDDGSSHQSPPATEYEEVCVVAEEPRAASPDERRSRHRSKDSRRGSDVPATAAPVAGVEPDRSGEEPRRRAEPNRKPATGREGSRAPGPGLSTASPEPRAVAARPASGDGGGPPATGLIGLAAAAALALAAWAATRGRARS
jgi:hypothetical protein